MKTFALTIMTTVIALPALAHSGTHQHPHGIEATIALIAVGVSVTMFLTRRKK